MRRLQYDIVPRVDVYALPPPGALTTTIDVLIDEKIEHKEIEIRHLTPKWGADLIRIEGFTEHDGNRCYCVAIYAADQSMKIPGILTIYPPEQAPE